MYFCCRYVFAIIPCVAIIATLRDCVQNQEEKSICFSILREIFGSIFKVYNEVVNIFSGSYSERVIMAFSLKKTVKVLFGNRESNALDIGCIHGIRSISTIALYIAHKLIPLSRMPYANRGYLTEVCELYNYFC